MNPREEFEKMASQDQPAPQLTPSPGNLRSRIAYLETQERKLQSFLTELFGNDPRDAVKEQIRLDPVGTVIKLTTGYLGVLRKIKRDLDIRTAELNAIFGGRS